MFLNKGEALYRPKNFRKWLEELGKMGREEGEASYILWWEHETGERKVKASYVHYKTLASEHKTTIYKIFIREILQLCELCVILY